MSKIKIGEKNISLFMDKYHLKEITVKKINSGLSGGVFLVKHEEKKYVLKICKKKSNLRNEVQFGYHLHCKGIPTAKIIKNIQDHLVTDIDEFSATLFEFCAGHQIDWRNISVEFSEDLAKIVSKMHFLAQDCLKVSSLRCDKSKIDSVFDLSNIEIIKKSKEIAALTQKISYSNLTKGLVHSDLTRENVLVSKDKNSVDAIIDFGDSQYDYIVWDLAVLITHIFITKTYGVDWNALSAFVKKYNFTFPLTQQEIDAIIPFMKLRNINLAIEVDRMIESDEDDVEELKSIENSVMTKIDIIEKNQERLTSIFAGKGICQ